MLGPVVVSLRTSGLWVVSAATLLLAATRCGGDDVGPCLVSGELSDLQGIYRIQENLTNAAACDGPGSDDDTSEELLVLFAPLGVDPPSLRAEPCRDLADCQERCAVVRAEYGFYVGDDVSGWSGEEVVVLPAQERCTYRYETRSLRAADGEITITESRHRSYSELRQRNEQCAELPERPPLTVEELSMRECTSRDDLRAVFDAPIDELLVQE